MLLRLTKILHRQIMLHGSPTDLGRNRYVRKINKNLELRFLLKLLQNVVIGLCRHTGVLVSLKMS